MDFHDLFATDGSIPNAKESREVNMADYLQIPPNHGHACFAVCHNYLTPSSTGLHYLILIVMNLTGFQMIHMTQYLEGTGKCY